MGINPSPMMAGLWGARVLRLVSVAAWSRSGAGHMVRGPGEILYTVAVVAGMAFVVGAYLLARHVRSRRFWREQHGRVFAEVSRALTDPLLIHQARRRLWHSRHGDH